MRNTVLRDMPRLSWGGIIAGVLVALGIQLTIGLFGLAISLSGIASATEWPSVIGYIVEIVTPVIASFCGALVAVRYAGHVSTVPVMLTGTLVWCVGLVLGALFLSIATASGAGFFRVAFMRSPLGSASAVTPLPESAIFARAAGNAANGMFYAGVSALGALLASFLGAAAGRHYLVSHQLERDVGRPYRTLGSDEDRIPMDASEKPITTTTTEPEPPPGGYPH